jgi:hypothetical protein
MALVKTVGELINELSKYDSNVPLSSRLDVMKPAHYHSEKMGNLTIYSPCYGDGQPESKFGWCDRARQLNLGKTIVAIRIRSL